MFRSSKSALSFVDSERPLLADHGQSYPRSTYPSPAVNSAALTVLVHEIEPINNGPNRARYLLRLVYLERNRIPSSSPLKVSGYIWSSTSSRMMLVEAV